MASKALVGRLSKLKADRFGKLITRSIPVGPSVRDVSVLFERLPPRTALPRIYHKKTAEIVLCLKGSMLAHLDGKKHRISAGDFIVIPPGARHQFVTRSRACEAISLFQPALTIEPDSDIHVES